MESWRARLPGGDAPRGQQRRRRDTMSLVGLLLFVVAVLGVTIYPLAAWMYRVDPRARWEPAQAAQYPYSGLDDELVESEYTEEWKRRMAAEDAAEALARGEGPGGVDRSAEGREPGDGGEEDPWPAGW